MKLIIILAVVIGLAWKIEAEECDIVCSMQYEPVCGINGQTKRTFSNPCVMSIANCPDKKWELLKRGSCDSQTVPEEGAVVTTERDKCNYQCNYFWYRPVCAQKGDEKQTFDGPCDIERANCLLGLESGGWKLISNEKCQ